MDLDEKLTQSIKQKADFVETVVKNISMAFESFEKEVGNTITAAAIVEVGITFLELALDYMDDLNLKSKLSEEKITKSNDLFQTAILNHLNSALESTNLVCIKVSKKKEEQHEV